MHSLSDPYPDALRQLASNHSIPQAVPELLKALLPGIQEVLGDNLIGVYLRGSLALAMDDFDPRTSDVDFLAVIEHSLLETDFANVVALHDQLATLPNLYAQHLEGTYIHRAAARRFHPGERHPTIGRQERLVWYAHDYNWVLERWIVRECGMTLLGPSPEALIDPISPDELREAVRLRLPDWVNWANQPDDPEWLFSRHHKAFAVETMCRALYTLATGRLQSKPHAVAWALANLPRPWRTTVERAQKWHADETLDPSINPEVVRFIHWTASQAE